jgi:hypothetical protein
MCVSSNASGGTTTFSGGSSEPLTLELLEAALDATEEDVLLEALLDEELDATLEEAALLEALLEEELDATLDEELDAAAPIEHQADGFGASGNTV